MNEKTKNFWSVTGRFLIFIGVMGLIFGLSDALPRMSKGHATLWDWATIPINVLLGIIGLAIYRKFKV